MSDKKTTTKRLTNKTEEELRTELFNKKAEDFKVELRNLEDKFNFRLEAVLHFSQQGVVPTINVVEAKKEVVDVTKSKK